MKEIVLKQIKQYYKLQLYKSENILIVIHKNKLYLVVYIYGPLYQWNFEENLSIDFLENSSVVCLRFRFLPAANAGNQ